MSATLMQVLDTTIVNVALPYMQGELGANSDEISWVLTSYMVSSAICMPLTGYFTDVLGRKRFLLLGISGFVVSSALCGIAQSLTEIVIFRLLQGVFGSALVPLSQAIMADAYPPQERGRAMALWGLGVMVGPVLGPTLGGWLTDVASWRWTFYINVPVGVLSFVLASQFVPDTARRARSMDWTGFAILSVGLAALQYTLDRGNERDWLSARDIQVTTALIAVCLPVFVVYSWYRGRQAVLDVHIFHDRNFATACLVVSALGLGMFGGLVIQPILLERLLDYPILTTGLVMAPRGIATATMMIIVGRLVGRVDARLLIGTGMLLSAAGSYAMTDYSLDIDPFWIIWPAFLQGLGLGLIFVPLSTIAYATLERTRMAEAAGIYSLVRTIGSAVGISIATTILTRRTQVVWNELGGHVTRYNPALAAYAQRLGLSPTDPHTAAVIGQQLGTQAELVAMLDVFALIAWSFVVMLPLLLLLERSATGSQADREQAAGAGDAAASAH
jgi:MFS transporter, DHA2 family, multidrug resistance protein